MARDIVGLGQGSSGIKLSGSRVQVLAEYNDIPYTTGNLGTAGLSRTYFGGGIETGFSVSTPIDARDYPNKAFYVRNDTDSDYMVSLFYSTSLTPGGQALQQFSEVLAAGASKMYWPDEFVALGRPALGMVVALEPNNTPATTGTVTVRIYGRPS